MANKFMEFFGFGDAASAPLKGDSTHGIVSPWQEGTLAPLVWSDIFGIDHTPVTRIEALRVPAVAKARAILIALISGRPLKMYNADGSEATDQPTWLYRSDTGIAPVTRIIGMLDDHIFNDATLLVVKRGAKDQIIDAVHVPFSQWSADEDGVISVNGKPVDPKEVLWIPGPGPGLLTTGAETIRGARGMERAWSGRVRNPTPTVFMRQKEEGNLTEDEVKKYLAATRSALQNPDGTVAFVPYEVDMDVAEGGNVDLFTNGRNDVRIDIANHLNVPVALLDGSTTTASLTYSTQEGKRNEVFDYCIPYWINCIEQGLSLDNVVPRGSYVKFDFKDYLTSTASPTGPETRD